MRPNRVITILATFILLFTFSSCSSQQSEDYSNTYNPATDYPFGFFQQGVSSHITASQDGYYILNGNYIYYMDKQAMKPVLLDNRPDNDCLSKEHIESRTIQNCNAFVPLDIDNPGYLQYYDGKLYTLASATTVGKNTEFTQRSELIEMSPDGSSRKIKVSFQTPPRPLAIHRGYLYYAQSSYDSKAKSDYAIMRLPLEDLSDKATPIYQGTFSDGNIVDIFPYGKSIYFTESTTKGYRTMRYDLESKTSNLMFSDEKGAQSAIEAIMDDRVFFSRYYYNPDDERTMVTFVTDLEGRTVHTTPPIKLFLSNLYSDGSYLYVRPVLGYLMSKPDKYKEIPRVIKVYDKQYRVVDTIDQSFLPIDQSLIIGDDRYMFVTYNKDLKSTMMYLDKQQLGSGKAAFRPLIESPHPYSS